MKKEWFICLACKIEEKVSPATFKSKTYLSSVLPHTHAATCTVGGCISGEIKLALSIRMLAGASYLDLMLLYGVKSSSLYRCFHECIGWINESFTFPLSKWLKSLDTAALREVSDGFAERSDFAFSGCIGAVDGIAIWINCPTMKEDGNPGQYYCHKGFFALNAQCICDSKKKILWISMGHIGSSHDSAAFASTDLFNFLETISDYLYDNGFLIAGDSAYPLTSFLIPPYSNAQSRSIEDDFIFWHSSSRINIECAFGEIIMRWGIFWRKLLFSLKDVGKIVNAACLLHNFIVDERTAEDHAADCAFYGNFDVVEEDAFKSTSTR
jgi:DDE superfamily endonuclease